MHIRELKAKAIIIASLLAFTNPLFTWDYFTIIGLTVRFITASKMVIDLISMVSPSGFTGIILSSIYIINNKSIFILRENFRVSFI